MLKSPPGGNKDRTLRGKFWEKKSETCQEVSDFWPELPRRGSEQLSSSRTPLLQVDYALRYGVLMTLTLCIGRRSVCPFSFIVGHLV
jgi:hypothetical protein